MAGRVQKLYLVDGEWMTQTEIAHLLGISRDALLKRLSRGWDLHEALTKPGKPQPVFRLPKREEVRVEGKEAAYKRIKREGRKRPFCLLWMYYRRREHGLNANEAFFEALRLFPPLSEKELRERKNDRGSDQAGRSGDAV